MKTKKSRSVLRSTVSVCLDKQGLLSVFFHIGSYAQTIHCTRAAKQQLNAIKL